MSNQYITGLFENPDKAQSALDGLLNASFRADEINVLVWEDRAAAPVGVEHQTGVGTGAAAGGALGGLLGAIGGALVSIGALPAVGLGLAAAGPIAAAASGAVGGTAGGGLVGAMGGLGFWKEKADLPDDLEKGGILLNVSASGDRAEKARVTLDSAGAKWVDGV